MTMSRFAALLLAVVFLVATMPLAFAADNANPNPGVIPPQAHVDGKTYGEWGTTWWDWVLNIASAVNPLANPTMDFNTLPQHAAVYFLVGSGTSHDVVVPPGRMLFFPLVNVFDAGDMPTVQEEVELVQFWVRHVTDLHCTVDGRSLRSLFRYRGTGEWPDGLVLGEENRWDLPAGNYGEGASDGYWIMLSPLPPGRHTVQFGGTMGDVNWDDFDPSLGWGTWTGFTVNVTYNITVKPAK
jgi:hypothetical protein